MIDLSIIVPIYKGSQYIKKIIKDVEINIKKTNIHAELIFVNDCLEDPLCETDSNLCKAIYIQNERNVGIHKSRINGLEIATGKYIVFLDQDDYIYPNYISSQIKNIGDSDASVCRLLNGDREHYTDSFRIEDVICKDFMLNNWNSIVSPGQVLIRKNSIPEIWINTIIRNNGADDYFLWLSMFASGCVFKINDEILFQHTVTGFNTSCDTNLMMDSEEEIINHLLSTSLFDEEEKIKLKNLKDSLRRIHIKQLDNIYVSFFLKKWLEESNLKNVRNRFGKKIGIYGAADIGTILYDGLKKVVDLELFFIDRNAKYISKEVDVYLPNEIPKDAESIIIAVKENAAISKIQDFLKENTTCKVVALDEFINSSV